MPRFVVWFDGEGGTERDIHEPTAKEAAERRVIDAYGDGEQWDVSEVCVRDDAGAVHNFTVDLDVQVSATAHLNNAAPAPNEVA